jgi:hypothetical protein
MANDHYISRFLTKPWEVGPRRLHYYDFASRKFDEASSESLFADENLHSEATGKVLDRLVESPVSDYRARVLRSSAGAALVDNGDSRVYRGLVGLTSLQGLRLLDARSMPVEMSLDELLAHGEVAFDEMAHRATEHYALLGVTVPSTARLFFTEAVYFPIPLVGAPPILGVPLSPRHFVALAPKAYDEKQLGDWLVTPSAITAFSLGVSKKVSKVILPPETVPVRDQNPAAFEQSLQQMRDDARGLVTALAKASAIAGLPAWGLTETSKAPP